MKKELSVLELLVKHGLDEVIKLNDLSRAILKRKNGKEPTRGAVDRLANKLKKHIPKSAEIRGDTFRLSTEEKNALLCELQKVREKTGYLIADLSD